MASKIEEIQGKTLDRTKTVIHHFIFPDNEDMDSNYAQIYFRWTRQQPECRHGKVRIPAIVRCRRVLFLISFRLENGINMRIFTLIHSRFYCVDQQRFICGRPVLMRKRG